MLEVGSLCRKYIAKEDYFIQQVLAFFYVSFHCNFGLFHCTENSTLAVKGLGGMCMPNVLIEFEKKPELLET